MWSIDIIICLQLYIQIWSSHLTSMFCEDWAPRICCLIYSGPLAATLLLNYFSLSTCAYNLSGTRLSGTLLFYKRYAVLSVTVCLTLFTHPAAPDRLLFSFQKKICIYYKHCWLTLPTASPLYCSLCCVIQPSCYQFRLKNIVKSHFRQPARYIARYAVCLTANFS